MDYSKLKKLVDEAGERTEKRLRADPEIERLVKKQQKFARRMNEIGKAIRSRQNNIFIEELSKALEAVADEKKH